jgi:hypothetical protein
MLLWSRAISNLWRSYLEQFKVYMPTRYLDGQIRETLIPITPVLENVQADGSILEARNVGFSLKQALPVLSAVNITTDAILPKE